MFFCKVETLFIYECQSSNTYCYHKDERAKEGHLLPVWLSPLPLSFPPFPKCLSVWLLRLLPVSATLLLPLLPLLELQTAGISHRQQILVNYVGYIAPTPMVGVITFLVIFVLHVYSAYLPFSCGSYFTHILRKCFQIDSVYSSVSFTYYSPFVDFTICC